MMQSDTPSVAVVMEIAAREGADPTELAPPLNDVIDPDALDALFARSGPADVAGSVSFEYCGYRVEVRSNGRVVVED